MTKSEKLKRDWSLLSVLSQRDRHEVPMKRYKPGKAGLSLKARAWLESEHEKDRVGLERALRNRR